MSLRSTIFAVLAAAIIGAISATALTHPTAPAPAPLTTIPLIENIGLIASKETSSTADIAELLAQHAKGKAPDDSYAHALLGASLVASDPAAAVSLARKKRDLEDTIIEAFTIPQNHKKTASSLIRTKAIPTPEAARLLGQLANGTDSSALLALQTNDPSKMRSHLLEILKADPQKAIADAIAQVSVSELEYTLERLYESWAKTDPAAAWNAITLAPSTIEKSDLQRQVIDEWFEKDSSKAATFFTENTAAIDKGALGIVSAGLIEFDPNLAIAWAEEALTPHRQTLVEAVAYGLGRSAPDTFIRALKNGFLLNSPDPAETLRDFATSYSSKHGNEALAWINNYQGEHFANIIGNIIDNTSEKQPGATFDFIENSRLSSEDIAGLASKIDDLALHDLPRYLALFESAPEDKALEAIGQAAEALSKNHRFEEARDLYTQTGLEDEDIEEQAQETITEWTKNDPAGAVDWVQDIPPGISRNYATQNLIDQWVRHDREGALTYAKSLPEGSPERQHSALVLAERLAAGAPDDALAWAREIANDDQLSQKFLNSKEIDSLIYHAPEQLQQLFPTSNTLREKIAADQAWRTYLRNYQPETQPEN